MMRFLCLLLACLLAAPSGFAAAENPSAQFLDTLTVMAGFIADRRFSFDDLTAMLPLFDLLQERGYAFSPEQEHIQFDLTDAQGDRRLGFIFSNFEAFDLKMRYLSNQALEYEISLNAKSFEEIGVDIETDGQTALFTDFLSALLGISDAEAGETISALCNGLAYETDSSIAKTATAYRENTRILLTQGRLPVLDSYLPEAEKGRKAQSLSVTFLVSGDFAEFEATFSPTITGFTVSKDATKPLERAYALFRAYVDGGLEANGDMKEYALLESPDGKTARITFGQFARMEYTLDTENGALTGASMTIYGSRRIDHGQSLLYTAFLESMLLEENYMVGPLLVLLDASLSASPPPATLSTSKTEFNGATITMIAGTARDKALTRVEIVF